MQVKLILLFLSVVAGTMIGYALFKRENEKEKYFESLVVLCNSLITDIRFSKNSITVLLQQFMMDNKSRLNGNLEEYLGYIKSRDKPLALSKGQLRPGEHAVITAFFQSLGTSDSSTQLYELENYKQKFAGYYDNVSKRNKTHAKNYIKLGFLFGLAVGILIL